MNEKLIEKLRSLKPGDEGSDSGSVQHQNSVGRQNGSPSHCHKHSEKSHSAKLQSSLTLQDHTIIISFIYSIARIVVR